MKKGIIAYIASGLAMVAADSVWLTLSANRIYRPELGDLLLPGFNVGPAVLFYLLYVFGVVVLIVLPAVKVGRASEATWRGALFGLVAYATYDLTNQSTLKGWSQTVTIADLCWGTFLTGFAATVGFLVTRKLAGRRG